MKSVLSRSLIITSIVAAALVFSSHVSAGVGPVFDYLLECNEEMCVEGCCVEVECEPEVSGSLEFSIGEGYYMAEYLFFTGESPICSAGDIMVDTDQAPTTEYECERDDDDDDGELEIEIEFDCEDDDDDDD